MKIVKEKILENYKEKTPSEYFHAPVIGKIITKEMKFNDESFSSNEYEVIDILNNDTYVCNLWYKEYKHIPQLVHNSMVEEFIKY